MSRRVLLAAGALSTLLAQAEPAAADLVEDAERLVKVWSLDGARVSRLPPVFAEHGRISVVQVPAGRGKPDSKGCVSVALLAARTVDFELETKIVGQDQSALDRLIRQIHGEADDGDSGRIRSVAGTAQIVRCGADRAELATLRLHVTSPRAAVEIVVAEGAVPLGRVDEALPERAFGTLAPRGDPGQPAEPGPLADRAARAERRAQLDGAARVLRTEMRASAEGTGEFRLRLPEGCHRIDVMAEVPNVVPRRATDVDAEAREMDGGRKLDRDRADAPDARLEFCLGETSVVSVPFIGASGAVRVVVSDAFWPIPSVVPAEYGPRARAGLAAAMRQRSLPSPRDQPIAEALGAQGDTPVPIAVEPGRCYFAAAAIVRGDARALRVAIELGDRALRDESHDESVGVAFCAETEERAVVRVSVSGSSPWWTLSVWPMD